MSNTTVNIEGFTQAELLTILEIARVSLEKDYRQMADCLDTADAPMIELRDKLRALLDSDVNLFNTSGESDNHLMGDEIIRVATLVSTHLGGMEQLFIEDICATKRCEDELTFDVRAVLRAWESEIDVRLEAGSDEEGFMGTTTVRWGVEVPAIPL